jgi:hypothetical protein
VRGRGEGGGGGWRRCTRAKNKKKVEYVCMELLQAEEKGKFHGRNKLKNNPRKKLEATCSIQV